MVGDGFYYVTEINVHIYTFNREDRYLDAAVLPANSLGHFANLTLHLK